MWSLPDINRMNSEASTNASKLREALRTGKLDGKKLVCEHGSWSSDYAKRCSKQLYYYLWYDIFSDDPKGIIAVCDNHEGHSGDPLEGYFTCVGCNRIMTENYTWELYYVNTDDGRKCLKCAAIEYIEDDDNWIELTKKNIDSLDFNRVRKAKHVIGVRMPVPPSVRFLDNVELDSGTGGRLITTSSCSPTPDSGVEAIREIMREASTEGVKRVLLILDAAYQFSVSIGVYADAEKTK